MNGLVRTVDRNKLNITLVTIAKFQVLSGRYFGDLPVKKEELFRIVTIFSRELAFISIAKIFGIRIHLI